MQMMLINWAWDGRWWWWVMRWDESWIELRLSRWSLLGHQIWITGSPSHPPLVMIMVLIWGRHLRFQSRTVFLTAKETDNSFEHSFQFPAAKARQRGDPIQGPRPILYDTTILYLAAGYRSASYQRETRREREMPDLGQTRIRYRPRHTWHSKRMKTVPSDSDIPESGVDNTRKGWSGRRHILYCTVEYVSICLYCIDMYRNHIHLIHPQPELPVHQ